MHLWDNALNSQFYPIIKTIKLYYITFYVFSKSNIILTNDFIYVTYENRNDCHKLNDIF